ncbi:MAG: hypothetical protein RL088_936 [Verrucomicrobiota bacterium]|jgi:hypothetical protein
MKSFRSTIVLVILGLVFWGYLKFYDDRFAGTDGVTKTTGIDRRKVDSFSIRNGEGELKFTQTDGVWMIETPVKDRADDGAVATLFTTLEGLDMNLRKVPVPKGKDIREIQRELGVAKGEVSIKLTGEKPLELLVGKETAVDGRVYGRIDGADTMYVLPAEVRKLLIKGVKDWRDRKLTSIAAAEVQRVILKTAKGEIEAERKAGNWNLIRPLKARADNQKMNDLIANTTAPSIEDFIADSKDLATFGLIEPRATLVFHTEGGKEPITVQIGALKEMPAEEKKPDAKAEEKNDAAKPAPKPPAVVYAKVSTRDGIVTVPTAIESVLSTQPNDLRDTSLLRVQPDIVDRITIESGTSKLVLGRDGEEWKRKTAGKPDEAVNSGAANKLLNDLTNAKAVRFVEDVASDLKKYALDRPAFALTLSSYSTEGTPESDPGEKPISKILLGNMEGDSIFAKLSDEPFIVAVPARLAEGLSADPLVWQDLKIYDLNKNDIVRLEIARKEQPSVTMELDAQKVWKLSKGDGAVNQSAVQSLINTLHSLRAVRWTGATDAVVQGLDKPSIVVQFTLADKKTGKLSIGSANADLLRHATCQGKTGTFLLNQPDVSAFEAVLIEGQKPATPPTPENAPVTPSVPAQNMPTPAPAAQPVAAPPKVQEAPTSEFKPAPESVPAAQ